MTEAELRALSEIARLMADRDLARLARLKAESAALAEAARALAAPAPVAAPDALDPASRAGAGPRWDRWRREELGRLQMARARLAAEEAGLRAEAQRSFGRVTALDELAARTAAEAKQPPG